jgi:hypothetical protein
MGGAEENGPLDGRDHSMVKYFSSWVGDHQRVPAIVCLLICSCLYSPKVLRRQEQGGKCSNVPFVARGGETWYIGSARNEQAKVHRIINSGLSVEASTGCLTHILPGRGSATRLDRWSLWSSLTANTSSPDVFEQLLNLDYSLGQTVPISFDGRSRLQ